MSLSLQKASFWKRISAYMFDFVLAITIAIGFASVFSALFNYDGQTAKLNAYYTEYKQEILDTTGIDLNIKQEEFDALDDEKKAEFNKARAEFYKREHVAKLYNQMFYLTLAIVSCSVLVTHLILFFAVPLFFKNGQTLGKKMFGLGVMRTNFTKLTSPILFARSIVGLYAMETMAPLLFTIMIFYGMLGGVGVITIGLIFALQILVMSVTKTNSSIHDLLADTVVIDFASQKIFDTEEELAAYKAAEQAELVNATQSENVII